MEEKRRSEGGRLCSKKEARNSRGGSIQDGLWCGFQLEERLQFSTFQKVEERSTTLPAGVAGATWPPQSLHSGAELEAAQLLQVWPLVNERLAVFLGQEQDGGSHSRC